MWRFLLYPNEMKAIGKLKKEIGFTLYDAPVPSPGPSDLLIRVKRTPLSDLDLQAYKWDESIRHILPVPLTMGRSFVGVVDRAGSEARQYRSGDRVFGEGAVACQVCRDCRSGKPLLCRQAALLGIHRPGSFAEYVVFPAASVYPLPKEVSDRVATLLPLMRQALQFVLSSDLVGEDLLITGATPLAILVALLAQRLGARHVLLVDQNETRLQLAKKVGVVHPLHLNETSLPDEMKRLGISEGFQKSVDTTGHPAFLKVILDLLHPGATLSLLGWGASGSFDFAEVAHKQLTIQGMTTGSAYPSWQKVLYLLSSGPDLSPLLAPSLAPADFLKAFDLFSKRETGHITLQWDSF
jgi:threonine 3-dehydrogenase